MACESPEVETTELADGLHPGLPADVYHKIDRASAHRLAKLNRSPAHMRWEIDNPCDQTPAMALGEAVHCCILEPERFGSTYAVAPECDRRTKEGKATWQAFVDANAGSKVIKADDNDLCRNMACAVWDHPAAMALLDGGAHRGIELSGLWTCKATGVACKLRADLVRADLGVVVDVKTTDDASRDAFERSIFNFNYWLQSAHYIRGLNACGVGIDGFVIIAVEKDPPHAVAVYRIDDEIIAAADERVIRLLEIYGKCQRTGKYPAYSDEVENVRMPAWAEKKLAI